MVGADLIGSVLAFPEATTTETHVPVREFFRGKLLDRTEGTSRLESFHAIDHLSNQRIEFGKNPLIHFWAVGNRNWRFLKFEAIHIRIQREESVSIVKGAKEFAANLVQPVHIKAQVVPRRRIGQHVPTQGIRTVFIHGSKWIHRIA